MYKIVLQWKLNGDGKCTKHAANVNGFQSFFVVAIQNVCAAAVDI